MEEKARTSAAFHHCAGAIYDRGVMGVTLLTSCASMALARESPSEAGANFGAFGRVCRSYLATICIVVPRGARESILIISRPG